jgi:hypothetical protein
VHFWFCLSWSFHHCLKKFISVACIVLSCLSVHVHVSTPYNSVFLKYTFYVVVLHFLSAFLFHNMVFHLFHSVSHHFYLTSTYFHYCLFLSFLHSWQP